MNHKASAPRILILSTSRVIGYMLGRMLEGLGHEVEHASDYEQARSIFDTIEGEPPAIVLVDEPSFEREMTSMSPHSTYIVLSQNPDEWDVIRLRRHGFDKVLKKPCSVAELSMVLQSGEFGTTSSKIEVLLADDSKLNRIVAMKILEDLGFSVDTVCNGREAVASHVKNVYDVILMDCEMPEMDGFEATRVIRSGEIRSDIPIIALTASDMAQDRDSCMTAGMNAYLNKPFEHKNIKATIEKFLRS